jgi:ureidoacrylate peracid hydrolase
VPKGSWDAKVLDAIAPADDEIVLPKTSSSVFISTNIDYVLRNLGVRQLALAGLLTDQCVESAVRDACDLGYLVTLVTDACATQSQERHDNTLRAIKGYCRQRTTEELLVELEGATSNPKHDPRRA